MMEMGKYKSDIINSYTMPPLTHSLTQLHACMHALQSTFWHAGIALFTYACTFNADEAEKTLEPPNKILIK